MERRVCFPKQGKILAEDRTSAANRSSNVNGRPDGSRTGEASLMKMLGFLLRCVEARTRPCIRQALAVAVLCCPGMMAQTPTPAGRARLV